MIPLTGTARTARARSLAPLRRVIRCRHDLRLARMGNWGKADGCARWTLLDLDCGHTVDRRGYVAPRHVRCIPCGYALGDAIDAKDGSL